MRASMVAYRRYGFALIAGEAAMARGLRAAMGDWRTRTTTTALGTRTTALLALEALIQSASLDTNIFRNLGRS